MISCRLVALAAYMLQACVLSVATSESYYTAKLEQFHSAVLVRSGGGLEVMGSPHVHHRALVRRDARESNHLGPPAQPQGRLDSFVQHGTVSNDATGESSNARGAPESYNDACYDENVTGLCLTAGTVTACYSDVQEAKCADLVHYCMDIHHGAKVRDKCLRTCGFCDLQEDTCIDGNATEEPHFILNGQASPCRDLSLFCGEHEIATKCKRTCGICATAKATTPAGTTAPADTCSRRRSMGFCYSRRRREN